MLRVISASLTIEPSEEPSPRVNLNLVEYFESTLVSISIAWRWFAGETNRPSNGKSRFRGIAASYESMDIRNIGIFTFRGKNGIFF